ncbi:4-alpha-glucanotransferase [Puia sp. P3]|uniref:4-alpha-glucanotransferase n=1 Tax=Puia sp. P3 TaxID=3423952 RepID=UPI003D67D051
MLVCGEDLGMVPRSVPDVMRQLGILSLEVQRMPKNPAREFFHPSEAPYLSVVTPSTHDMSTIRGWWEERQEHDPALLQPGTGSVGRGSVVPVSHGSTKRSSSSTCTVPRCGVYSSCRISWG